MTNNGKERIDDNVILTLKNRLPDSEKKKILEEATGVSEWIYEVIRKACAQKMTLMKQYSKTDILADIQNSLKKVYVQKQFGEYTFFINENGTIFNVEDFPGVDLSRGYFAFQYGCLPQAVPPPTCGW